MSCLWFLSSRGIDFPDFWFQNWRWIFSLHVPFFGCAKFNFLICRLAGSRKIWCNIDKELVWERDQFHEFFRDQLSRKVNASSHSCAWACGKSWKRVGFFTNLNKEILYGPVSTCLYHWRWYILLGWRGYPPALINWLPTSFAKKHGWKPVVYRAHWARSQLVRTVVYSSGCR